MAQFPALPLWTDAYLADTKHLTTLEHGAYLLLLIAMWRAGGALPNDDRKLARFAGVQTNQWGRIKPSMMEFMRVSADGLTITQGRLSDELQYVRDHAKKQAGNARSRWQKDTAPPKAVEQHPADPLNSEAANPLESNDTGNATASIWQCQTDAPTPTPIRIAPDGAFPETGVSGGKPKAGSKKRQCYPDAFEAAWKAYPTTTNMSKAEGFKEWGKLDAEDQRQVAKAIPGFVAYCKATPDYHPVYFERFIRQRRFDGYAESAAPAVTEADWRRRLIYARNQRIWSTASWGPMPGCDGCMVPAELLTAGDGSGWADQRGAA
jgi:uncharacterized protein YdaU (DUF1376 family)